MDNFFGIGIAQRRFEMLDLFGDDIIPGKSSGVIRDDVRFIFEHWKNVMKKKPTSVLDKKRKTKIIEALKLGYPVDFLCRAIDGCSLDDWHMGRHPRNKTKYDEVSLILRDAIHIEKFESIAAEKEIKSKKTSEPVVLREIWELQGFNSYSEWIEKKNGIKIKTPEEIKQEIKQWANRGKLLR